MNKKKQNELNTHLTKENKNYRNLCIYLDWKYGNYKQTIISVVYHISPTRVGQIIRQMCRILKTCRICKEKGHLGYACPKTR